MPVYADPWQPFVYGTPADSKIYVTQGNVVEPFAEMVAVVLKQGIGTFWNGTEFVPFADMTLADIAIAGTMPTFRQWEILIPWSAMGNGDYEIWTFKRSADSGGIYWRVPWTTKAVSVRGPRSYNPDGLFFSSDYGGEDALRVIDTAGNGIGGVKLKITATPSDNNIVYSRGQATTASDGRWDLDGVLQPNTPHRIKFTKAGYTFDDYTFTTGSGD